VREPDNKFDPAAIRVEREDGAMMGYVPAHVAGGHHGGGGLARDIDEGIVVLCRISALTGGGEKTRGVNIEIARWCGTSAPTAGPWEKLPLEPSKMVPGLVVGILIALAAVAILFLLSKAH
jgi:hypothetical protein